MPAPLDFGCAEQAPLQEVMPQEVMRRASELSHWICENAKSCRAFLKRIDALYPLATPLQQQSIVQIDKEKGLGNFKDGNFKDLLLNHDVGLISEAGMPAVADPGSQVVRLAHDLGVKVHPLVGASALLLTLAASGLNGQSFAFVGYLPRSGAEQAQRISALEKIALREAQTQMFIETPYRNQTLWQALLSTLRPTTRLVIATGLTLPVSASVLSRSVQDWRKSDFLPDKRTPAVFALGN